MFFENITRYFLGMYIHFAQAWVDYIIATSGAFSDVTTFRAESKNAI